MSFTSMSLSEGEKNINTIRRYAKSKELSLRKVRNKDSWDVVDTQTGKKLVQNVKLSEAYALIDRYPY